MEKEYAQALYSLSIQEGAKASELVDRLAAHLKETGRIKLLPRILRELKRIGARKSSFGESLEVASADEKAHAEKEAKELGITVHAHVNHSLIKGWRARKGSRVIDRSAKRTLLDLYRKIVTHA